VGNWWVVEIAIQQQELNMKSIKAFGYLSASIVTHKFFDIIDNFNSLYSVSDRLLSFIFT